MLTNWQPKVPDDARLPRRLRVVLELGDPGEDTVLASLQDEARNRLPTTDLIDRVAVTATAPGR